MRTEDETLITHAESPPQKVISWLQPHLVFLWFAIPFGLAVLGVNPPFQAPDESDHYLRTVQLSQGDVLGERRGQSAGGMVPDIAHGIVYPGEIAFHPERKMTAAMFRQKATPLWADWSSAAMGYAHFGHTVYYAPLGYTPQAASMILGKLLHVGPLGLLYLARLTVFVLSLLLGYEALRRMPVFGWTAMVILLVPMSLYLMGSMATDGMLIGSGFLLAAMVGRRLLDPTAPEGRELALAVALCVTLAMPKPVYLPLAGAAGLLFWLRLETDRQRLGFALAFAAVCLLPLWVWGQFASEVYVVGRTDIPIDPAAQLRFVLAHPWTFGEIVTRTLLTDAQGIYQWFVGTLGWGDTLLPTWYYRAFGVGVVVLAAMEALTAPVIAIRARVGFALAALASVGLILLAQYMSWSSPGAPVIEGVCGRYFLPVVPFVLLSLPTRRRARSRRAVPVLAIALAATGAVVCLVAVFRRFYVA